MPSFLPPAGVYRADDLRLGQPVALKFLPASAATDSAALARLHNEVRIARQVSHPNVCRIHDLGDADGEPFLTMEYGRRDDQVGPSPSDQRLDGHVSQPEDAAFQVPRYTLPPVFVLGPLYSAAQAVGQFAWIVQVGLQNALGVMLLLVVLTSVLRQRWLATVAFFAICVALMGVPGNSLPSVLIQALVATVVVMRFGILAAVAYTVFYLSLIWFPVALDPNGFYMPSWLIVAVLLLGLGWCALYTSLGGKPLGGWTESQPVSGSES